MRESVKYSVILGMIGAVLMPVMYEIYANISKEFAILLMGIWWIYCGAKFSKIKFKQSVVGMVCTMAYSGILGFIGYIIIHPAVRDHLNRTSKYFQLALDEQALFVLYGFLISLLMFVTFGVIAFTKMSIGKFKLNRQKTKEYIENAFDDDSD